MSELAGHYSDDPERVPVRDRNGNPIDGPGYVPQSVEEQLGGRIVSPTTPDSNRDDSSVAAARADRSQIGEWSEGLEPYGVTEWQLPGQGDRGAGCGEWYPDAVCETCGEPEFARRVCGARSCPDCWGVWAKDSAVRPTVRLQSFRYMQPDDRHRQMAHGYVSPPEGEVRTEREYWEWKSKAAEIAKEKGWRGFAVIAHPYRPTAEAKKRYRQEDPDYGIWVWLRGDIEDMDRHVKWSPHYHIIGATGADMEPANDGDNCIYRFERSLESFDGVRDRESHEDLYGLFRYLLSHTGFPAESTRQATTWYGDLANSVFVEDASEEWQIEKPSKGVRSALEREVKAVAGDEEDDEEDESARDESDEVGECPVRDCEGLMIDVFDVRQYLRQADPPPDVQAAMVAALEWRLGERQPPPGLRCPQSEADAAEAFEAIL